MGDAEWGGIDEGEDLEEEERIREEAFGGKDSIIFLIDCSPAMFVPSSDDDSPFQLTIKSIVAVAKSKIISSERDLLGLVLFGTDKTKSDGFEHVYVLRELQQPSADFITSLDKMVKDPKRAAKEFGHHPGFSLADALWQCSSVFARSGKLSSRRVLLFTNEDHPHMGNAKLQKLSIQRAVDLSENGIELELMNINKSDGNFDVGKFYKDLLLLEDDADYTSLPDASSKFEELLTQVRRKDHKKRTTTKLDLKLSGDIAISVGVYNLVRVLSKPSPVKLDKASNEEVQPMSKRYLQETGEILLPTDIKYYQEFGGQKLYFDKDEMTQMKQFFSPEIRLLGFKPRSSLLVHHHMGPASFLFPNDNQVQGSTRLFSALLQKCAERNVIAVCCATLRKSSAPVYVALLPQKEEKGDNNVQITPAGFHLIPLPFAEDFRELELDVNVVVPSEQETEAAKAIIKKLQCPFNSENFENPVLQTHWRNIEALALDLAEPEPMVDCTVPDNEMMESRAGKFVAQLKNLVYPHGCAVSSSSAAKRKNEKPTADVKRVKTEAADIKLLVSSGQLAQLTVTVLKSYCTNVGITLTGRKKADLIEALENHYQK